MPAERSPSPVKAVFFDIGNVLLRFSSREVLKTIAWEVRGCPVKLAKYLWHSDIGERIERGEVGGEELYALFQKELGYKGTPAQFRLLWCDHFTLDRGTYALLKRISKNLPTYLLSNTNAMHIDFIRERYEFPSVVRGAILSHELGLRKPDPAIYRAALKLSGTKAEETVFVDDLKPNVESAKKLGMIAIRFKTAEDLRRRFETLGIA
ncbi:MAG TPA: HAD family phosphatase [Elusimicrobiota bacterium]|nr:HAD family phosphatase [Elusimicrobiota bacterium]